MRAEFVSEKKAEDGVPQTKLGVFAELWHVYNLELVQDLLPKAED